MGVQMVPVLNAIKPHAALIGNHDFDFGVESLMLLMETCNFGWLMSNVKDVKTNRQLAEGKETMVIHPNCFTTACCDSCYVRLRGCMGL